MVLPCVLMGPGCRRVAVPDEARPQVPTQKRCPFAHSGPWCLQACGGRPVVIPPRPDPPLPPPVRPRPSLPGGCLAIRVSPSSRTRRPSCPNGGLPLGPTRRAAPTPRPRSPCPTTEGWRAPHRCGEVVQDCRALGGRRGGVALTDGSRVLDRAWRRSMEYETSTEFAAAKRTWHDKCKVRDRSGVGYGTIQPDPWGG
jgi:hypothetical protein